jgi:ankyrin repeat protein
MRRMVGSWKLPGILALLACAPQSTITFAAAAYRCTAADGSTVYADTPCGADSQPQVLRASPAPARVGPPSTVFNGGIKPPPPSEHERQIQALQCATDKFNAYIRTLPRPLPDWSVRRVKQNEIENECRRAVNLSQVALQPMAVEKPAFGGAAGDAIASRFEQLVRSGSVDQVREYLSAPTADINDRAGSVDDKALLDYAAELNQKVIAQWLIDHGATVDAIQKQGRNRGLTALHRAAMSDSAEVAEVLLDHGAEINYHGPLGATPLILAASNNRGRSLNVLLTHGADIATVANVMTPTGLKLEDALTVATERGYADIAKVIARHAAAPSLQSLGQSAMRADVDAVRLAMKHDEQMHDIDQKSKDEALSFAAIGMDSPEARREVIDLLVAHGADVNSHGEHNSATPVMQATTLESLEALIAHGASLKVDGSYGAVVQALGCSSLIKDPTAMFNVLLAHGVDIAAVPKTGLHALECAVTRHRVDFELFLLNQGVPADLRDSAGRTAVYLATDAATLGPLTQRGAKINVADSHTDTPLTAALSQGNAEQARLLVNAGANAQVTLQGGQSPLSIAARAGQLRTVTALIARGADVNAADRYGETALLGALDQNQGAVARYLIEHGANVNVKRYDGATALHLAASHNDVGLIKLLMSQHADVSILDREHLPAWRRATSMEVRALFPSAPGKDDGACARVAAAPPPAGALMDAPPVEARDPSEDWSYYDQAAEARSVVVSNRPYLLGVNEGGPVYLAVIGHDGVEDLLCEFDSRHRIVGRYDRMLARSQRDGQSMSLESLKVVGVEGAQALLDASHRSGNPISLGSDSDGTLLGDAMIAHRDDVLRFYLEHGVDPDLARDDHPSKRQMPWHDAAIYTASEHADLDAMTLLLEHGANPDGLGDYFQQPGIAWALANGRADVEQLLLSFGADPNLPPKSYAIGRTVENLSHHTAPLEDQLQAIHSLFVHGADPNPWIFAAFQIDAGAKNRDDILRPALNSRGIKAEYVRNLLTSPGSADAAAESVMRDALAFRDAAPCPTNAADAELMMCLPNDLRAAVADLQFDDQQAREWSREIEQRCHLRSLNAQVSAAGWFAYVLNDRDRTACVLKAAKERRAAAGTAAR